tara:strand:- start:10325 stop:10567 length:243 start_codon:yes stop_codon:yes gene_type:complete
MNSIKAIKTLIEERNEGYSDTIHLKTSLANDIWGRPVLTIKGFEASSIFACMKSLLEPMVASVNIVSSNEVKLNFNNLTK